MLVLVEERGADHLQLRVTVSHDKSKNSSQNISKKYLCGTVYFQLQVDGYRCPYHEKGKWYKYNVDGTFVVSARYLKAVNDDNLIYYCEVFALSDDKQRSRKISFTDVENWQQVTEYKHNNNNGFIHFTVSVEFEVVPSETPYGSLYEDTELTDADLKAQDGSVSVHSAIVAGISPVLKKKLTGNWQESSKRYVILEDATIQTLEHFKSYIYLGTLPDTGLKDLLLLSLNYMIPDLVQRSCVKILYSIKPDNIVEYLEFAVKYQVKNLLVLILQMIHENSIDKDVMEIPIVNYEDVYKSINSIVKK